MNNTDQIRVIVDAGHGGEDPGAVYGNLKEKDLNLQAALYMYKRLNELGIPAKLTRGTDESLPKNERIQRVLQSYNNDDNVILISNHINAGGGEGAEIVYALRNSPTLATLALNNIGEAGQIKRKIYQRRLPENPNLDYYYIIRETGNAEPLLVEYGFIDNANDIRKLQNNLNDYAEGVVKAIAEYINVPYQPPGVTPTYYYIVQKGDTLYKIARMFNTTVSELKRINNLIGDNLQLGQRLFLKEPIQNSTTYKVQKGDTLYSIANKLNTTVDELKRVNNLTTNNLFIGQELIIPQIILPSPEEPDINQPELPEEKEYIIYEVQKGDSLWKISRLYSTTVDEIIELNNLINTSINVGDKLKIPTIASFENYTVKRGDTLWSIAKQYNISVDTLKKQNNLSTNLLSVGQTLVIPK